MGCAPSSKPDCDRHSSTGQHPLPLKPHLRTTFQEAQQREEDQQRAETHTGNQANGQHITPRPAHQPNSHELVLVHCSSGFAHAQLLLQCLCDTHKLTVWSQPSPSRCVDNAQGHDRPPEAAPAAEIRPVSPTGPRTGADTKELIKELATAINGASLGVVVLLTAGATWDEGILSCLRHPAVRSGTTSLVLVHAPESCPQPSPADFPADIQQVLHSHQVPVVPFISAYRELGAQRLVLQLDRARRRIEERQRQIKADRSAKQQQPSASTQQGAAGPSVPAVAASAASSQALTTGQLHMGDSPQNSSHSSTLQGSQPTGPSVTDDGSSPMNDHSRMQLVTEGCISYPRQDSTAVEPLLLTVSASATPAGTPAPGREGSSSDEMVVDAVAYVPGHMQHGVLVAGTTVPNLGSSNAASVLQHNSEGNVRLKMLPSAAAPVVPELYSPVATEYDTCNPACIKTQLHPWHGFLKTILEQRQAALPLTDKEHPQHELPPSLVSSATQQQCTIAQQLPQQAPTHALGLVVVVHQQAWLQVARALAYALAPFYSLHLIDCTSPEGGEGGTKMEAGVQYILWAQLPPINTSHSMRMGIVSGSGAAAARDSPFTSLPSPFFGLPAKAVSQGTSPSHVTAHLMPATGQSLYDLPAIANTGTGSAEGHQQHIGSQQVPGHPKDDMGTEGNWAGQLAGPRQQPEGGSRHSRHARSVSVGHCAFSSPAGWALQAGGQVPASTRPSWHPIPPPPPLRLPPSGLVPPHTEVTTLPGASLEAAAATACCQQIVLLGSVTSLQSNTQAMNALQAALQAKAALHIITQAGPQYSGPDLKRLLQGLTEAEQAAVGATYIQRLLYHPDYFESLLVALAGRLGPPTGRNTSQAESMNTAPPAGSTPCQHKSSQCDCNCHGQETTQPELSERARSYLA